jgi:hypothetical protein
MKRFLALVVTALVAVGLYAATAGGTQQSVTPAQFAALKKQVTKLQKDVSDLKSFRSCIGFAPIVQFGTDTAGYHYKQPDGSEILTTALDLAGSGETPDGYFATVDQSCVTSLHAAAFHGSAQH